LLATGIPALAIQQLWPPSYNAGAFRIPWGTESGVACSIPWAALAIPLSKQAQGANLGVNTTTIGDIGGVESGGS